MKVNKLYNLDCREGLSKLEDESINCCISSPPYWSLRDYGLTGLIWDGDHECDHIWTDHLSFNFLKDPPYCVNCGAWFGSLGLEPNFELYIKHLVDIYDKVKRVLKKSGTCWVNLGDSYGGSSKAGNKVFGNPEFNKNRPSRELTKTPEKKISNKFDKCLLMLPQRFTIEMINRGWILRNVIIWDKPNCMPSSAKDRFTVDFEYVYFFVKKKKYWFEQQRETNLESSKKRAMRGNNINKYSKGDHLPKGVHPHTMSQPRKYKGYENMDEEIAKGNTSLHPLGRNKRTVWKIPTKPNPEAHFATFPPNLISPMIKSGCPEYVCLECGKPREKIIEKTQWKPQRKHKGKGYRIEQKVSESSAFNHRADWEEFKKNNPDIIKGYSDCGCGKGFESGIVLDPFSGIGTTLKESWRLGRNYIGFELSKEYCEIAKKGLNLTKNKRLDDFF